MLNFERAAQGIGKVFKGEILTLIATLALAVSAIAGAITLLYVNTGSDAGSITGSVITLVLIIGSGVLAIIGFIFQLIGLNTAGSQNSNFKTALYLALFSFALTIVSLIINAIFGSQISSSIISTAETVVDTFSNIFVIIGCAELLTQKGDTELAEKAALVQTRVLIAFLLAAVFQLIPGFVTATTFDLIFTIGAAICQIIAYIQYLMLIKATRNSLLKAD